MGKSNFSFSSFHTKKLTYKQQLLESFALIIFMKYCKYVMLTYIGQPSKYGTYIYLQFSFL